MLQTKKRYVGYMYESLDQKNPVFDAKGIETVRRDGCPAVAKVTSIPKLLFFFAQSLDKNPAPPVIQIAVVMQCFSARGQLRLMNEILLC